MRAAASLKAAAAAPPMLPAVRAGLVFLTLTLLFGGLAARALYLQGIDTAFLQERGAARYSRDLDVPAHRGRITDRWGDPLAISTPVKSLWAFPDQLRTTPSQLSDLARVLGTTPQALARKIDAAEDFVYLAKHVAPDVAERALALRIKGLNDESAFRRFYPGGDVTSHLVGFTGDKDAGQEGMELAQQAWLGGKAGSRRVIINRRGDVVEDVASIRAPQEGRDLALAIDSRLQYLAFRELKAAIDANKAHAGGLVILDVKSGEILALANWPTYNPNNRDKVAREKMRMRALTDTFEPGSTLKPFTAAAALDSGIVRPDTVIQTGGGTLTIGSATIHDAHPAGRADRRAGDPEIVERRRREDRAVAARRDACGRSWPTRASAPCRRPGFPARSRAGCGRRSRGSRSSRRRSATATASRSTWSSSPAPTRSSRPTAS
jgi:cell division protein FtsI (penicillin-binding protein 3)